MPRRPNILFIMSDDHAAHAISAYGSRINQTPHIDRIAEAGLRGEHVYCTNAICAPSRAAILAGTYNHINGVRTLSDRFDGRQDNVAKQLQAGGYHTAIIGKWHLGHGEEADPTGFDHWCVLPGQGEYWNPHFLTPSGQEQIQGYCTDIITDLSLDWLKQQACEKQPWFLMCHHKAPHREWAPHTKYQSLYEEEDIPLPETYDDDHSHHARAAREAKLSLFDLTEKDLKGPVPAGLSHAEEKHWRYQRYLKDYLRCVASVDESVGRMLDYLVESGQFEDTLIIYTSDQGFFLGDHGWYDKRFMYEESLRMPYLASYPRKIPAGTVCREMITNVDFAPTWLDYAGLEIPAHFQGRSAKVLHDGQTPEDWPQSAYYRYWMHKDFSHNVWAHYGIRTHDFKLIYYYADALDSRCGASEQNQRPREAEEPEWELFDLRKDPHERFNVYHDVDYEDVIPRLTRELYAQQSACGDQPYEHASNGLAHCVDQSTTQ